MNEALDEAEKLLPIDALGVVMIVHGEEHGDDSVFGTYSTPYRAGDYNLLAKVIP